MLLAGRTALVTGASSGLGRHFAHVLAAHGARLLVGARRLDRLEALAAEIGHDRCTPIALDLSDPESIELLKPHIGELDILVNNAGVTATGPALELNEANWDHVMDVNLKAPFLVAQLAAKAMRAHGRGGSIVNIASILGLRQANNLLPYAVSKSGAIQLTKILALEWARHDIRVNAIAPGYIDTELNHDFWDVEAGRALIRRIPQRRLGELRDLDGPLLLLASDASRYMTGSILAVDGGHLVSAL